MAKERQQRKCNKTLEILDLPKRNQKKAKEETKIKANSKQMEKL